MDEEKIFQGISYALSGVFASVVIVWGLTGNALSFVVLLQPQMRSPMSTFLSIQVVWDTLVLLGTLFLVTLPALFPYFRDYCHPYVIIYVYPVWMIARTSSIWTTVGLTVMRYIVVCHPLKGKMIINEELGWRVLSEVRIVLVTLNSAINVLVYGAMGRKFRHAFKCTFTCNHDTRRYTRWIYHPVGSNLSPSASLDNSPLSIALRAFRFEVPGQGQLNVTVECP
ncbi:FMRFamide receptor-like [Mya arenaria]|uniref:FMRFamide receptor-like n=1 Tax=Mya arenaria TaxID=6604 RepID=UPI0022E3FD6E|nr:FMRFamide receptor-like [Mya arenaria]